MEKNGGCSGDYTIPEHKPMYAKEEAASFKNTSHNEIFAPDSEKQGYYTVYDLEKLPESTRVELIDGVIVVNEAPTLKHQELLSELTYYFEKYIHENHGSCNVYQGAGVHLNPSDVRNELIPDLSVVCEEYKKTDKGIFGAPDLVIEVLSPSTRKRDTDIKYHKYLEAGVREYWMIDIRKKSVTIVDNTVPDDRHFRIYGFNDQIPVAIYGGKLEIDLAQISEQLGFN